MMINIYRKNLKYINVILFNEKYRIELIQYSDLDGRLYTYEANSQSIDVKEKGFFIANGKE